MKLQVCSVGTDMAAREIVREREERRQDEAILLLLQGIRDVATTWERGPRRAAAA